jgi:hypothetical protein
LIHPENMLPDGLLREQAGTILQRFWQIRACAKNAMEQI